MGGTVVISVLSCLRSALRTRTGLRPWAPSRQPKQGETIVIEVDPHLQDHAIGLELQIVEVVHQVEDAAQRSWTDEEVVLQAELDGLYDELVTLSERVGDQTLARSSSGECSRARRPGRPVTCAALGPGQRVDAEELRRSLIALTEEVTVAEPLAALRRMAELAERSVGSCDAAAVSVMEGGGATTVATAETAKLLNAAQYRLGDGPGPDAIRQLQVFRIDSVVAGDTWPEFSRLALDSGILSSLSVPLIVGADAVGTLNLYSHLRDGFDGCEQLGLALAAPAARPCQPEETFGTRQKLSRPSRRTS